MRKLQEKSIDMNEEKGRKRHGITGTLHGFENCI